MITHAGTAVWVEGYPLANKPHALGHDPFANVCFLRPAAAIDGLALATCTHLSLGHFRLQGGQSPTPLIRTKINSFFDAAIQQRSSICEKRPPNMNNFDGMHPSYQASMRGAWLASGPEFRRSYAAMLMRVSSRPFLFQASRRDTDQAKIMDGAQSNPSYPSVQILHPLGQLWGIACCCWRLTKQDHPSTNHPHTETSHLEVKASKVED